MRRRRSPHLLALLCLFLFLATGRLIGWPVATVVLIAALCSALGILMLSEA